MRYSSRAVSDRADRIIRSNPKIPSYSLRDRALRPGSNNTDPSLDSMHCCTSKSPSPKYTGNEIAGIATMHKSNAVPVRKDSTMAVEISRMRRG